MRIRDWSSDVCSSDLPDEPIVYVNLGPSADTPPSGMHTALFDAYSGVLVPAPQFNEGVLYWITRLHTDMLAGLPGKLFLGVMGVLFAIAIVSEIGRASCRESVCQYV